MEGPRKRLLQAWGLSQGWEHPMLLSAAEPVILSQPQASAPHTAVSAHSSPQPCFHHLCSSPEEGSPRAMTGSRRAQLWAKGGGLGLGLGHMGTMTASGTRAPRGCRALGAGGAPCPLASLGEKGGGGVLQGPWRSPGQHIPLSTPCSLSLQPWQRAFCPAVFPPFNS